MLELRCSEADVLELDPDRRERLLWSIHARRLVGIRDRVLEAPVFDERALQGRQHQLQTLDLALFPGSVPLPTAAPDVPHGNEGSS